METTYKIVNPINDGGVLQTSQGEVPIGEETETADKALADEIGERYPYLEVAPYQTVNRLHPMRVGRWPGLPWLRYDERGRVIHGDVDTQSPAA